MSERMKQGCPDANTRHGAGTRAAPTLPGAEPCCQVPRLLLLLGHSHNHHLGKPGQRGLPQLGAGARQANPAEGGGGEGRETPLTTRTRLGVVSGRW